MFSANVLSAILLIDELKAAAIVQITLQKVNNEAERDPAGPHPFAARQAVTEPFFFRYASANEKGNPAFISSRGHVDVVGDPLLFVLSRLVTKGWFHQIPSSLHQQHQLEEFKFRR